MSGLVHDARYAFRLLRRQPSFSLFVVLTLAVGIGANTAVFSVVNGVLLRPLPYEESDRLVAVWGRFDPESGFDFPQFVLSNPEYLDYREHSKAMEDVAAFATNSVTVGGPGADPERVRVAAVTGNLFELLRVRPALGRTFSPDEMKPGAPMVAVLSHGYWHSRFGSDPEILGRTVPMNGAPATIIGVMPGDFAHPQTTTRMWLPLRIDPANPGGRSSHGTRAIGRLAPGVEFVTAQAELQTLMDDWKVRFPEIHTGHYLFIRPLLEDVAGTIRPALMLLLAAAGFVLLIVCANVASVVLARGEARTREMAIRGALGAERNRLVRLSLIESGLLAAAGGVLGMALANVGVRALITIDPTSVPRASELGLDYALVAFAAVASMVSAVLFGLMPAYRGARGDLQSTLREASQSTTGGAGRQLFRRSLVAVEVALSVLLVIGAGLMLRSFARLTAVDPGFSPEGLVSASVSLPAGTYKAPAQIEAFYSTLVSRLQALPGVTAASAGSTVPLWNDPGVWDFEIEGRPAPAPGQMAWNAKAVWVRPGYFETLGVPLVRGRYFIPQDDERAQLVAIVNEAMASKFFPGEDPIGRRVRIKGNTSPDAWMTVVGITGDVRTDSLDVKGAPSYHFLQSQLPRSNGGPARTMSVIVRTASDPALVMSALRTTVRELDPSLALSDVQTSQAIIDQSIARPRFTAWLLTLFAGVGLVLGASGIYGVLAFTVARRTQEIGIRRALGAQPRQIVRHVLAGGMKSVAVGLAIGLLASYWTSRYWSAQLFEVSPADPLVYLGVIWGVSAVALAAMVVPLRRALNVSPVIALRDR